MKSLTFIGLVIIILGQSLFAQEFSFDDPKDETNTLIFKPSIGLGAGMFTFYGDVTKKQKSNSATLSRVGFNLNISQEITPFLDGGFHFLKGKVGANERSDERNINFESDISMWGINVSYNFDHFLRKNRDIEPFVTAGIESFEFLSKTDLFDKSNNFYHYWSDGTIRDLAETSASSTEATRLQRDYTYESDIRELNLDNFGYYPEKGISFPIGIGVNLYLMRQFSFMIGTNIHFTGTDLIDGITNQSIGGRSGGKSNDKFLYSYVSLNYRIKYGFGSEDDLLPDLDDDDLLAFDEDGDRIIDFIDECPKTPEGVEVDEKGCPIDTDKDGIADYIDLNPFTYDTAVIVNNVVINMASIEKWYERWNDSTGSFAGRTRDTITVRHYSDETLGGERGEKFMVRIGEFSGGLPSDVAEELLSIPDVNTWEEGGITYITVGSYDNVPDALKRQLQLSEEGFSTASVVSPHSGRLENINKNELEGIEFAHTNLNDPTDQLVYRVQIGAFKSKLSRNVFTGIGNLVVVPFEDGLTRYFSGSSSTFEEAAKKKIDMIIDGFQGAFIVAFKNGKRVPLEKTGQVTFVENSKEIEAQKLVNRSTVSPSLVNFSIQLGVYKNDVPSEQLEKLMTIDDIQQERTTEGLTRYYSGKVSSYEEANSLLEALKVAGFTDSQVIGRFKGKTITAQEAIELSR